MNENLLEQQIRKIMGKEDELLDAFAKAVVSDQLLRGMGASWIARNIEMVKQTNGTEVIFFFRVRGSGDNVNPFSASLEDAEIL